MSKAESVLKSFCELLLGYVLAMHAAGLVNLFTGRPAFREAFPAILAAAVTGAWLLYRGPLFRFSPPPEWPFPLPIAILAAAYAVFLLESLISYPTGYDAISYHLPIAASWMQTGSVHLPETWWKMSLPANGELFAVPAMSFKAENLLFAGNLLAAGLLGLSVYVLAQRVSGSSKAAVFATIGALGMPVVMFQSFVVNVDIFGSAFLFASLAMLFSFAETGSSQLAVLSALCAGAAMGTKHVYIAYAGLILLAAFVVLFRMRRLALVPLLIAASALPSALWIVRNWQDTGNPAYPFAVHFAGIAWRNANDFPPFRVVPSATGPIGRRKFVGSPFTEDRGLGPAFAAFALASVIAAILECRRRRNAALVAWTTALIALAAVWWTSMHVIRFGLPLFLTVPIFSAILYARLADPHRKLAAWLLTACLAVSCAFCVYVPLQRTAYRFRAKDWSRAAFYGYPGMLDSLPYGARVLDRSFDDRLGFVLLGNRLTNRVMHMDAPLNEANLRQWKAAYAIKSGNTDPEDRFFTAHGTLVYEGTPATIFPAAARPWRVYRLTP